MIKIQTFDWKASPGEVIEFVVNNPGHFLEVPFDGDQYVLAQSPVPFTVEEAKAAYEKEWED